MNKHIIVVAKYYSPMVNARAIQATEFIKLLSHHIHVTLITSGDYDSKEVVSETLTIYRIAEIQLQQIDYTNTLFNKIKKRLRKEVTSTFGGEWSKNVTTLLSTLIKNDDVVLSMSEPFDSHIAVLNAKKTNQFRWFSFFSDPLPHMILPAPYNKSSIFLFGIIQKSKVTKVLKQSECIFFTNSKAGPYIAKKLNVLINDKSYLIRHLSPNIEAYGPAKEKHDYLAHIGHLTKERVNRAFFSAIVQYINSDDSINRVVLVGKVSPEAVVLIENEGWCDFFELIGEVAHCEALNIVKNAKAVLLIEANVNNSPFVPSKLAEYFTIMVPIIAIANKDSETHYLINKASNGVVCDYEMSIYEMVEAMSHLKSMTLDNNVSKSLASIYSKEAIVSTFLKCLLPKDTACK